jgi:hypothetical protein
MEDVEISCSVLISSALFNSVKRRIMDPKLRVENKGRRKVSLVAVGWVVARQSRASVVCHRSGITIIRNA